PLVPLSPLKPGVERRLSEMLGRKASVDSLRLSLAPRPHLKISGLTVSEDPAFGDGLCLTAGEVLADLNLLDYARDRRLAIDGLTIKSPQVSLVRNTEGVWSWTTLGGRSSAEKAQSAQTIQQILVSLILEVSADTLRHLIVEDAAVKVLDRA